MESSLRAGVAQTDITPPAGTPLAGDVGVLRAAQTFVDPLFAKALVVESAAVRICIVALDVTIITRQYSSAIRDAAATRFGFAVDAVMVHATQTHSAPGVGGFLLDDDFALGSNWDWMRFRDDAYAELVVERSLQAIEEALGALQPVEIGVGSTEEGGQAWNRRAVTRNGGILMPGPHRRPPVDRAAIAYLEGPIDPELGVLALRPGAAGSDDADSETQTGALALLLSYTCHPVHLFTRPGGIVSADWPGAWSRAMQAHCTPAGMPMVLNGACGDINPWHPYDAQHEPDQENMGRVLGCGAERVLAALSYNDQAAVDYRSRTIELPLREVPADQLAAARRFLEDNPEPLWKDDSNTRIRYDWIRAALLESVHLQRERDGTLAYEMQVMRIGDCAFVGLPGEPFAWGGLQIKMGSPAPFTFIVHGISSYAGYIPPRHAYPHGGHEVDLSYWAKVAPGSLETIIEVAGEMLGELFA